MSILIKALILVLPVVIVSLIGIRNDFILLLSIGLPFFIVGILELIMDFRNYRHQVPFLILLSYISFSLIVTGIGALMVLLAFASR